MKQRRAKSEKQVQEEDVMMIDDYQGSDYNVNEFIRDSGKSNHFVFL